MDGADQPAFPDLDKDIAALAAAKTGWAQTPVAKRLALLDALKDSIMESAQDWVAISAQHKNIDINSPVGGEEWLIGPFAALEAINAYHDTLSRLDGKTFLNGLKSRRLPTGQTALRVLPSSLWERLLFVGHKADLWMQPGVSPEDIRAKSARAYDTPEADRQGRLTLVLGAGNITAIPVRDTLYKLFVENSAVLLKMNPVNGYLAPIFARAMAPLIEAGALRIVTGGVAEGAYLSDHTDIDELHLTGSEATYNAIVWGAGEEGAKNRAAGTPKNTRRFTAELGSVSPTIVVPGPWSATDIRYQAENIATMKLINSGHNCIACQALILPEGWDRGEKLLDALREVVAGSHRPAWYPGSSERVAAYAAHGEDVEEIDRGPDAPALVMARLGDDPHTRETEVFGPALGLTEIAAPDAKSFLRAAIAYANDELHGTLGANILIHPATLRRMGRHQFEEILSELHYGTIGINVWCGFGYLASNCTWGAFPGHTPDDIQSGIGVVHNALMLDGTERSVVQGPWRVYPRPPYFITNRNTHRIGKALTRFQHRRGWRRFFRVARQAMRG